MEKEKSQKLESFGNETKLKSQLDNKKSKDLRLDRERAIDNAQLTSPNGSANGALHGWREFSGAFPLYFYLGSASFRKKGYR